jgi:ParB/RepB/Spo0J family partition protein
MSKRKLKVDLNQHMLFQTKLDIATKKDIIVHRIETFGNKIVVDLPLSSIDVRPQVRKTFDMKRIQELAHDVQSKGLIHPITVMKHPETPHQYILVVGGNRYEAYKLFGEKEIPCIVKEYTDDEVQIQLIQISENLHRTDINPIELSDALMSLREKAEYTLEKLAKAVGRNIDSIKQYSRIHKLSIEEKEYHRDRKSSKNDILKYLAQKDTTNAKKKKEIINDDSKLALNNIVIWKNGKKKDSEASLKKKIEIAEQFILEAKTLVNNHEIPNNQD